VVGQALVDDILRNGRHWYKFANPSMPVEFQTGAYRFGHSIVRPSYRMNLHGDPGGNPATGAPAFVGFIFDPAGEHQTDPVDLRGGARARRRFVGWQTFFDFGGDQTQHVRPNKLIDTAISSPLFRLPLAAIPSHDGPTALPQRTLLRHLTWSMPSGQRIAASTGSPVLGSDHFPELRQYNLGLDASTPLWYYILREASVFNNGAHLGPVGGRGDQNGCTSAIFQLPVTRCAVTRSLPAATSGWAWPPRLACWSMNTTTIARSPSSTLTANAGTVATTTACCPGASSRTLVNW
jgi:hypothetical protein